MARPLRSSPLEDRDRRRMSKKISPAHHNTHSAVGRKLPIMQIGVAEATGLPMPTISGQVVQQYHLADRRWHFVMASIRQLVVGMADDSCQRQRDRQRRCVQVDGRTSPVHAPSLAFFDFSVEAELFLARTHKPLSIWAQMLSARRKRHSLCNRKTSARPASRRLS